MMFKSQLRLSCAIGALALLGAGSAHAQSAEQIDKMQAQINALQQQIATLKGQVKTTEQHVKTTEQHVKKAEQHIDVAYTKAPAPMSTAVVDMSANNRPEICTPDKMNCIALTGRLHLDAGTYSYSPNSSHTSPQSLDSGVNARRARLGVVGKFAGDFNYYFVYDFGGSSDGFGSSVSGGATSGIENAYVSYTGFKPLALEAGYMDTPYTLDEATSSNDIMFMERASSQVIASNLAAGDNRFAAGIRGNTDRLWAGAYFTGPTSGTSHVGGTAEQSGAFGRVTYQVLQDKNYSLHIGGDVEILMNPQGSAPGTNPSLTLSDRPELRIDPTSILSTGAIANVDGAQVYSAEAAGGIGPFFVQGEYFHYVINRGDGLGDNKFDGGYVEASYTLTGESRKYIPTSGAYSGIVPDHPFKPNGFDWGAWEIAGRYSVIDLNDGFMPGVPVTGTDSVAGGKQTVYTAGLNWYLNRNVRVMFNYLHGDIDKYNGTTTFVQDVGAKFDAFATRVQVAF
jgi:phosphate-selective porin OprO/OprP